MKPLHQDYYLKTRPINPRPGLFLMLVLSLPYLANRVESFPRSKCHDMMIGIGVIAIWIVIFNWQLIRRRYPFVHTLLESVLGFVLLCGFAALFGTVYGLLLFN